MIAITEVGCLGPSTSTLIGENAQMMSASGSSRFYSGETDKDQFKSMGEVNTKLVSLLTNIDTLADNKATTLSSIETYNT